MTVLMCLIASYDSKAIIKMENSTGLHMLLIKRHKAHRSVLMKCCASHIGSCNIAANIAQNLNLPYLLS